MPSGPMAHPTKSDSKLRAQQQRCARLAAELRSNLHKRKEQMRNRSLQHALEREAAEGEPDAGKAPAGPRGEVA